LGNAGSCPNASPWSGIGVVSLSIGSTDPIDHDYSRGRFARSREHQPHWIIGSLSWTESDGRNCTISAASPTPKKSAGLVVARVGKADAPGRQILLENVSSYLAFHEST